MNSIINAIKQLDSDCTRKRYRGYDPYDALKSPVFRLPLLKTNKLIRFGAQQFVKRCPINLRPVLGVPKGYNPVTLGLFIQGYSYLALLDKSQISGCRPHLSYNECMGKTDLLIDELKSLIPEGYHGNCWGYDFPWEARYASIAPYQPTVVATGIIANALYSSYKISGNELCASMVKDAAGFVLHDLNKKYSGDSYIFSYSPFDSQQVFNASMKGVRILAQAYSLSGDDNLKNEAKKAVRFVVSQQRSDGSWGYSLASGGGWSDNYHTGYILDCLHDYRSLTGDNEYDEALRAGYDYYLSHFIEKTGMPAYYHDKPYPADCTAGAQTILTLVRFGNINLAAKVAKWMIDNMQSSSGNFYYRKYRHYKIRTDFMRWSDAWMFAALSYLLLRTTENEI